MTDVTQLPDITLGYEISPQTKAAEQVARALADLASTPGRIGTTNFISVPETTAISAIYRWPMPNFIESMLCHCPGVTCIANFNEIMLRHYLLSVP